MSDVESALAQEALARTAELETDLKKVAVELAEYKEESSHLKNQDIKITSLNQRIRQLEAQLTDKVGFLWLQCQGVGGPGWTPCSPAGASAVSGRAKQA